MMRVIASLQISPILLHHRPPKTQRLNESPVPQTRPINRVLPRGTTQVVARAGNGTEKQLVSSVKRIRTVCWISFWTQLALSLASAGVLFFTLFATQARPTSSLFLLVGVGSALISTGIVRKILDDARSVVNAPNLSTAFRNWNASGWLLRNTDVNLIGMASSIIALQGECGMLVAKLLRTSTATTPYTVAPVQGAPASIDVFSVQGCANVLLSHFVSLFFLTFALRLVQKVSSPPPVPS